MSAALTWLNVPPAIVRSAEDLCRCSHCLQSARQFPHDPPQLALPLRLRAQPGQLVDLAAQRARRPMGGAARSGRAPRSTNQTGETTRD